MKGLFINPPGNIWTGFHTTFEGDNRVFQKVQIPYFTDKIVDTAYTVTATIIDQKGKTINTVSSKPLSDGYNHLIWNLDEQSSELPGYWMPNEYRNIPVLPGVNDIILSYGRFTDTSQVQVIPDPRFDLDSDIDDELYAYQKEVDKSVKQFVEATKILDNSKASLDRFKDLLSELEHPPSTELLASIDLMRSRIMELRATGKTPRPKRQVGAWQSPEVTAYTKLKDVKTISLSKFRPISDQERLVLHDAELLVKDFSIQVDEFMNGAWNRF